MTGLTCTRRYSVHKNVRPHHWVPAGAGKTVRGLVKHRLETRLKTGTDG